MPRRKIAPEIVAEQRLAHDLKTLDFASVLAAASERQPGEPGRGDCPLCRGAFGPVLDAVDLVRGTVLLTAHRVDGDTLELRQITSTIHVDDTDTLPPMDAISVIEQLSKAESFLLSSGDPRWPETRAGRRGWVAIGKQRRARGHGFQTIRLLASEPKHVLRDREFTNRHGGGRPSVLETTNPPELLVGEFRGGLAAQLVAEPRRAFETILYCRPSATGLLSDLSGNQRWGLAQALRELTGALKLELSVRGLPVRYSWRLHAGEGLEPYVRIAAHRSISVADGPREWVERLKSHIGVE
ncbi:MAG TPA: hypothetical protein VFG37_14765 [Planctomycetota bacterium]|nr:hypothetical protein [Planctomycetota bacterium]